MPWKTETRTINTPTIEYENEYGKREHRCPQYQILEEQFPEMDKDGFRFCGSRLADGGLTELLFSKSEWVDDEVDMFFESAKKEMLLRSGYMGNRLAWYLKPIVERIVSERIEQLKKELSVGKKSWWRGHE